MWILTDAMCRVVVHSDSVSCPESFKRGGTSRVTPDGKMSSIVNPRGSNKFNNPDICVNFLSEILPPYKSDIKLITPDGVIPIKAFRVL